MRRFIILCAFTILAASVLPAVAQAPRVPPPNDNAASATALVVPAVSDLVDSMDESGTETGEPAHQCVAGGPDVGDGSVWYRIQLPGGDLTVDTAQSEFNTAITVYIQPAGPPDFATMQPVGCADHGAGGSQQARLKLHLGANHYLVQISALAASIGGADRLRAEFSFDPDKTPKGDNIVSPIPVTIGKVAKSTNVQYALTEAFESAPSCDINGTVASVWFKLVVPFSGTLLASGEGSLVSSTTGVDDRVTMTVYRGSNFVVFTEIECSDDAAVDEPSFTVSAGDTLWIRMSVNFPTNMFRPGTYKLSLRYVTGRLLVNTGFESDLSGWKLKKANNGDGITTTPGEPIAGSKAFKFVGSSNEATSLKQNVAIPATLRFRNAILTPSIQFRPIGGDQELSWTVTFVPRDGSAPVKLKYSVTATCVCGSTIETFVPIENVSKIILQFKNKNASGSLVLDSVDLLIEQFSILRDPGVLPLPSVLPLPPAPAGFRSPN